MGHSEISETPSKTRNDILPACLKGICVEKIFGSVGVEKRSAEHGEINIFRKENNKGNCEQSNQHHKTLEEVCPANRLEAAEEGVSNDYRRKNEQRRFFAERGDNLSKNLCARNEA